MSPWRICYFRNYLVAPEGHNFVETLLDIFEPAKAIRNILKINNLMFKVAIIVINIGLRIFSQYNCYKNKVPEVCRMRKTSQLHRKFCFIDVQYIKTVVQFLMSAILVDMS